MLQPKPIARESIDRALAKAERYRLLNEPEEAESICRDVLAVDPANQPALICLILAHTDGFKDPGADPAEARALLSRLTGTYDRAYYAGVIDERWAKALHQSKYGSEAVRPLIESAMARFQEADDLAPAGNDDAVLRWNACIRFVERHRLRDTGVDPSEIPDIFSDDVPMR